MSGLDKEAPGDTIIPKVAGITKVVEPKKTPEQLKKEEEERKKKEEAARKAA